MLSYAWYNFHLNTTNYLKPSLPWQLTVRIFLVASYNWIQTSVQRLIFAGIALLVVPHRICKLIAGIPRVQFLECGQGNKIWWGKIRKMNTMFEWMEEIKRRRKYEIMKTAGLRATADSGKVLRHSALGSIVSCVMNLDECCGNNKNYEGNDTLFITSFNSLHHESWPATVTTMATTSTVWQWHLNTCES